ncbi:MAG TPA: cytochrome c [Pyrinomonadaceae bacterium]
MIKTIERLLLATMLLAAFVALSLSSAGARSQDQFDAAGTYKAKCVACHGPKAEKKFDCAKADDEHTQTILKGKKMEKPPNMPGFEEKGINADQAKALLEYMKSLKTQ